MFIGEHALWSRHVPVFTARHSALLCVALHCLSDLTSPHSPSGSLGASLTGLPALLFSRRAGRPVTCSGPLHSLFPLPRRLPRAPDIPMAVAPLFLLRSQLTHITVSLDTFLRTLLKGKLVHPNALQVLPIFSIALSPVITQYQRLSCFLPPGQKARDL